MTTFKFPGELRRLQGPAKGLRTRILDVSYLKSSELLRARLRACAETVARVRRELSEIEAEARRVALDARPVGE